MPNKRHYLQVPVAVVHVGIAAFALSLLLNITGILVLQIQRTNKVNIGAKNVVWTDKTSQLPIGVQKVAFEVTESDRYGMHDDEDWHSLFPPGAGYVKGGGNLYSISMYHQLHCMNTLRRIINQPRNASETDHHSWHALHCFHYLRQTILCSADTTLELGTKIVTTSGKETVGTSGMGVVHECRDWMQIRRFAEENYATWEPQEREYATSEPSLAGTT